ncbi:hypothetical protein ACQ4M4_15710 [Leptolyngbya sp. AN02str]|uniref:hypothetical protein n=1 Tax=Leptolyngbya sp. AN02str TaxID=3423363 RepID=UPI003D3227D6
MGLFQPTSLYRVFLATCGFPAQAVTWVYRAAIAKSSFQPYLHSPHSNPDVQWKTASAIAIRFVTQSSGHTLHLMSAGSTSQHMLQDTT